MSNAVPCDTATTLFLQNQPFTTLLSVTSAASSCLVNRQRERAFMSVCMYCTSVCVCVCVCGFVYVCVKRRWSERGSVRVRGENEAGHKGCTEDQRREGGERKTKEWWCWRWWWGGGGEGGGGAGGGPGRRGVFEQITHCTLLNSAGPHTHIKVVPPICPRLSRPLSTPHVTPYILLFMLNN